MERKRLIGLARTHLGHRKSHRARERGFLFHHGLRVAQLCIEIAERHPEEHSLDRDILFAGGLFHDVGKGDDPHNETGADRVLTILSGVWRDDAVAGVSRLVREHNRRGRKGLPLDERILQDADHLDHVGAQMVWLSLLHAGSYEQSPEETLAYYHSKDHQGYLRRMREGLNLEISRQEFDRRLEWQEAFFRRLAGELEGKLFDEARLVGME